MFASHSMGAWFGSTSLFRLSGDAKGHRFRFSAPSRPSAVATKKNLHFTRELSRTGLNAARNMEAKVRSELIFRARETVDNKFKLCQTTSKATRRLHIAAKNTTDTINDVLSRIAGGDEFSLPVNPILAS
jgi:hypothetical protein